MGTGPCRPSVLIPCWYLPLAEPDEGGTGRQLTCRVPGELRPGRGAEGTTMAPVYQPGPGSFSLGANDVWGWLLPGCGGVLCAAGGLVHPRPVPTRGR